MRLADPAADATSRRTTRSSQAARELLAERGFDGMTMDAVADRAGAGKATVYRRWPSKVQLTVDAVVCARGVAHDRRRHPRHRLAARRPAGRPLRPSRGRTTPSSCPA